MNLSILGCLISIKQFEMLKLIATPLFDQVLLADLSPQSVEVDGSVRSVGDKSVTVDESDQLPSCDDQRLADQPLSEM